MSDLRESRAERMARYKEERRRQLAAQFKESTNKITKDSTSSSSDGPRTTKASRLRAAAAAAESNSSPLHKIDSVKEIIKSPISSITSPCDSPRPRLEKDKSSKRKSNLNRSLACEEVPLDSNDDNKNRRRRHRFFPPDVLQSNPNDFSKSDVSLTANNISPLSSPNTASTTVKITPKKSELSIHMENARKGVTAAYSDTKSKVVTARRITSSPIKRMSNSDVESGMEINGNFKQSNKENIKRKTDDSKNLSTKRDKIKVPINTNNDVSPDKRKNIRISARMDELTALTRDTLARVERLANKNRESPKRDSDSGQSKSKVTYTSKSMKASSPKCDEYKNSPLKKKNESVVLDVTPSPPVSILKRKVSQEESKYAITTQTPPVTFSPNVIEPTTTNRKQGILKKRRSLDESQVLRHRSCSPDVAKSDSRSILKNQRRSSLEDIIRIPSDTNIQGILKRRTSRNEEDLDNSLNSPQSILKRRSGASSAGSSSSTHHHVSIATAVILAAAEGAEIVLDSNETVKPILKKKSISEDCPNGDNTSNDLKPILKKKSSTDTDDSEDKPKRPILKSNDSNEYRHYQSANESGSECEVKPILKSTSSREETIRPRLSFCGDDEPNIEDTRNPRRRSQTITGFEFSTNEPKMRMPDRDLTRPRVISVADLVMGFEKCTGAIPKRPSSKRNSDRYMTQPITFNELEASLNFVRSPQRENFSRLSLSSPIDSNHSVQSLLDLTSSIENDSRLNSFLSNSIPNTSSNSGKMSSDSAFQSLGDGLELEQEELPPPSPKRNAKLEQGKLELQMKAIAEEAAKKMKSSRVNSGIQKYRNRTSGSNERASSSRFSTQPITLDEVQEAAKINHEEATTDQNNESEETDPSKLSLSERIKLFSKKQVEEKFNKLDVPRRRTRFSTQPITYDEVETARIINTEHNSTLSPLFLDEETVSDRRGILKQKLEYPVTPIRASSKSPPPKSAMKNRSPDFAKPRPILKYESAADFTYDEGISSNDSDSDSDVKIVVTGADKVSDKSGNNFSSKSGSDQTSDESSGGREIQSIIGREALLKRKQLRSISNGNLQKSKSQAGVVEADARPLPKGVQRSMTTDAMQRTICQLQEQLKQNGDSEWRKRLSKLNSANEELNLLNVKNNIYNDELSEKASNLKAKKDELDASSKQWKNRVEKTDAVNYSVAGRMQIKDVASVPINITNQDKIRRTPKAKRFKGKEGDDNETSSSPASPNIDNGLGFRRSISVPTSNTDDSSGSDTSLRSSGRKVTVMRPDDDTYQSFFQSVKVMKSEETVDVSLDDFDSVTRHSESLLVQKKNVRVQKRRGASKNPLKTLAARSDIKNEYTEVTTGIAQRETKRLNIEKLSKNSHLALEALAGLASKEDFAAVALKKSSLPNSSYLAYKNLMLLQVKGRRHVQVRLVEPVAASINQGDNYILVTPDALFNYIGAYSNVIEQSRAADIINHIQSTKDLGCKVEKPIVIKSKSYTPAKDLEKFWGLLGADASAKVVDAGHPDEDEVYESTIVDTNMIYYVENDALVPLEEYWGSIPKIEMLKPSKVLVFDFGSEMYVWNGRNANVDEKRTALRLAKQLWENGYNYSDCSVCPLNVSKILGAREKEDVSLISDVRPDWALFAKVSQHGETILFREKFLDWPDYSRVIKVREEKNSEKTCDIGLDIKPCDANALLKSEYKEPDFEMEGSHLGRGRHYYDTETNKHCEIKTLDVTSWIILENTYEKLDEASTGHFYDGDSYIIKWNFRVTVTGRELSGKPSKHLQVGRDRCIYFYWLGKNSSVNEKGAAAILTVELDSENAKQIRVTQGSEHPMFLQLFNGKMFIHSGKRDGEKNDQRLYICRGEIEHETVFIEVPCSMRSLRSRTSFLLVESDKVTIWNGAKSLRQTKEVVNLMAEYITTKNPPELELDEEVELKVYEEGKEDSEFLECLGEKRQLYNSLVKSSEPYKNTLRMFMFNSISGKFEATEVLCHHRSLYTTPYPFLQSDLYSTNQPAIFLLDNCHELWLWQGWWPERESDQELSEQTGSGAVRWQAERKAAMQTAMDYWKIQHPDDKSVPAYLVWAGLEPLSFTNLFPIWCDRDDIAELNMKEGKKAGDIVLLEKELALLTRTTYPLAELLQRPLPEGVDPTHLEIYLSSEDFHSLLSMSKEEFQKLPTWKQTALKKDKGLF